MDVASRSEPASLSVMRRNERGLLQLVRALIACTVLLFAVEAPALAALTAWPARDTSSWLSSDRVPGGAELEQQRRVAAAAEPAAARPAPALPARPAPPRPRACEPGRTEDTSISSSKPSSAEASALRASSD